MGSLKLSPDHGLYPKLKLFLYIYDVLGLHDIFLAVISGSFELILGEVDDAMNSF